MDETLYVWSDIARVHECSEESHRELILTGDSTVMSGIPILLAGEVRLRYFFLKRRSSGLRALSGSASYFAEPVLEYESSDGACAAARPSER